MSLNYTDGIYCLIKMFVLGLILTLLVRTVIDLAKHVITFKAIFYRTQNNKIFFSIHSSASVV